MQFCRAAQTGCSSLMQLQDFGVTRKLLGHGARCSPGCCRAAQTAICCALHSPQCSLGISGLVGRSLMGHNAAWVLCRAAQATCAVVAWCSLQISGLAGQLVVGWHQAAHASAEQHSLAAAAWCSFRNWELAGGFLGVVPGTVRAAAEQHRWPSGGGARHSTGCCRAAQAAMLCPVAAQCSLGISGLVG